MERKFWSFGDEVSYFGVFYKSRPHQTMYDMFVYLPSSVVLDHLVLVQLPVNVTVKCSLENFSLSFPLVFRVGDPSLEGLINPLLNNQTEKPIEKVCFEWFRLLKQHLNQYPDKTPALNEEVLEFDYLRGISSQLLSKLQSSVHSVVKKEPLMETVYPSLKPTLAIHHRPPTPEISLFGIPRIQKTERRGDEIIVYIETDRKTPPFNPTYTLTFKFPLIVLFQLKDVIRQPKCLMKAVEKVEKFFTKRPLPLLKHHLRDGLLPWFWNTYIPLVFREYMELKIKDPYPWLFSLILGLPKGDAEKVFSSIDTTQSLRDLKVRYSKVDFKISVSLVLPSLTHIVITFPLKDLGRDELSKLEETDKETVFPGKVYYTIPRLSPFYVFEVVGPIPETAGRDYQLFREIYLFDNNEEFFDGLLNDFSKKPLKLIQLVTALSFFLSNAGTGSFRQLLDFYLLTEQRKR